MADMIPMLYPPQLSCRPFRGVQLILLEALSGSLKLRFFEEFGGNKRFFLLGGIWVISGVSVVVVVVDVDVVDVDVDDDWNPHMFTAPT